MAKVKSGFKGGAEPKSAKEQRQAKRREGLHTADKAVRDQFKNVADFVTGKQSLGKTLGKSVKTGLEFSKGIAQGIFNHPDFFKYNGELMIPAHNVLRPFDPKSVEPITRVSGTKFGPGPGVTHVVKCALVYNDPTGTDAWDLAVAKLLQEIRINLRSNLPYSDQAVSNYLQQIIAIFIKAKAVEKQLGWYSYTRGDIPEVQDALHTTAYNYNEVGLVNPDEIVMTDRNHLSESLAQYKILQSIIKELPIPKRLAEFISWWVASNFIDQKAPNPQIYVPELRVCPVYDISSINNNPVQTGIWDVATSSVEEIVHEAKTVSKVYAMLIADIVKKELLGKCELRDIDTYQCSFLCDYEFFTILVNNYRMDRSSGPLSACMNPNYARVDMLPELSESNYVGVANALAHWGGFVVPFEMVSQAAYFTSAGYAYPRHVNVQVPPSGVAYASEVIQDAIYIQYNGVDNGSKTVNNVTANTAQNIEVSANARWDNPANATINSVKVTMSRDAQFAISDKWMTVYNAITNTGHYDSNFTIATGVRVHIETDANSATAKLQTIVGGSWVDCHTFANTVANIASISGSGLDSICSIGFVIKKEAQFTSASNNVVQGVDNTANVTGEGVAMLNLEVNATISTYTYQVDFASDWATLAFISNVDYHFPGIYYGDLYIKVNGNQDATVVGGNQLIKECYVPMVFNYDDLSAVFYWMYRGLFSITSND